MKIQYIRDSRSPTPKNEATSRVMRANKGKNTTPEIKLRKELRKAGLSDYKLHFAKLPGRPDLIFKEKKIAIFVNGCFWHRCPFCKLSHPKTNRAFWRKKIENNVARDKRNIAHLRRDGWRVAVIWECRMKRNENRAVTKIAKLYTA